jgi:hypothetical protein
MCYSVYISTDSTESFDKYNSDLVKFEKLADSNDDTCTVLLEFPYKWYVGSKTGCGCSFRHLLSIELGFSDPVDWYEEEQDDIDATLELYSTLSKLLSAGYQLDLIDQWHGANPDDIITINVSLDDVSSTSFRMFENHRFRLMKKTQGSSADPMALRPSVS